MYVCMYVYKYSVDIYLLCKIKFRVRWCTRSMWTMLLPCGKLIGLLLFCLLFLLSILFLKPNVLHQTFSRTELARPVMGTIFLVGTIFSGGSRIMKRGVPKKRCYVATPIFGKTFYLQLYDGEFSPGMQNRGLAFVKF